LSCGEKNVPSSPNTSFVWPEKVHLIQDAIFPVDISFRASVGHHQCSTDSHWWLSKNQMCESFM